MAVYSWMILAMLVISCILLSHSPHSLSILFQSIINYFCPLPFSRSSSNNRRYKPSNRYKSGIHPNFWEQRTPGQNHISRPFYFIFTPDLLIVAILIMLQMERGEARGKMASHPTCERCPTSFRCRPIKVPIIPAQSQSHPLAWMCKCGPFILSPCWWLPATLLWIILLFFNIFHLNMALLCY